MTRQCWTNLVLTAVICKLFMCHILCNCDTIICGCIASEREIVSNEVQGMCKKWLWCPWTECGKPRKQLVRTVGVLSDIETGYILYTSHKCYCLSRLALYQWTPHFSLCTVIWIHGIQWSFGRMLLVGDWECCCWWYWLLNCPTVKAWAVQCSCVTGNILCLFEGRLWLPGMDTKLPPTRNKDLPVSWYCQLE